MPFSSSNAALDATFNSSSGSSSVIPDSGTTEVTSAITLPTGVLEHHTFINITGTPHNISSTDWLDGAAFKTLDPGESVTLTRVSTGKIYVNAQYENLVTGIGTTAIGSTFTIG